MILQKKDNNKINWRVLTFALIIFQSIGIRFFVGQGIFISIFLFIFHFNSVKLLASRDYRFLFISTVLLFACKLINPSFSFSSFIYQILLVFSAYFFLIQYRNKPYLLQKEFFTALTFFVYHALIGYVFCLVFSDQFVDLKGSINKTFYYLFYTSNSSFGGIMRNTGLFWEPGVFQVIANLYLFYCIKFNLKTSKIFFAVLAVISSLSTSGLVILVINFLYLIYSKWKSKQISFTNLIMLIFFIVAFIPVIISNATDKLQEENTSGLVRLRDYRIGIDLIKEKPLFGHGIFDANYLKTKPYVKSWESILFTDEYLEGSGEMGGGYTNGILGLIAWYGIPISFLLFFFYFKNKFIDSNLVERFVFCFIFLISMISEPISYTSLFLIFPLSYWILNVKYKNY